MVGFSRVPTSLRGYSYKDAVLALAMIARENRISQEELGKSCHLAGRTVSLYMSGTVLTQKPNDYSEYYLGYTNRTKTLRQVAKFGEGHLTLLSRFLDGKCRFLEQLGLQPPGDMAQMNLITAMCAYAQECLPLPEGAEWFQQDYKAQLEKQFEKPLSKSEREEQKRETMRKRAEQKRKERDSGNDGFFRG